MTESITALLEAAILAREALFDEAHISALRLFNGFSEGCPELVIDLYGATAVLHSYSAHSEDGRMLAQEARQALQRLLPWLRAGILKLRSNPAPEERSGRLLFGESPDRKVKEHGVWYALDLRMHQDASLYLDTRNLRKWAIANLAGRTVLNTFAYTGSLGVAARAGGASHVLQTDLDRKFLDLARTSYTLNRFACDPEDLLAGDFFPVVSALKRANARFDCIFLDPPFFSTTPAGSLDLNTDSARLINKLRPLVADGGRLVAVNNALYVSGADYMGILEALCADGYLKVAGLIPVPVDVTGYAATRRGEPPADPAPFNHSTKIAVLEVRRKPE